jgi:hypothetical protein
MQVTLVTVTESLMFIGFDLRAKRLMWWSHAIQEAVYVVAWIREAACWCCSYRIICELWIQLAGCSIFEPIVQVVHMA